MNRINNCIAAKYQITWALLCDSENKDCELYNIHSELVHTHEHASYYNSAISLVARLQLPLPISSLLT